jgi:hypothetical protein
MAKVSGPTENQTLMVNESLAIELMPTSNRDASPALCLHTRDNPEQSIVILLSEIHLLRDALVEAGARLSKMRRK